MNNQNNPHHHHHHNQESNILRRVGIQIESEDQDTNQDDYILYNTILGKVKDIREFTEQQISNWVTSSWITHDSIQVKKVGKIFFFLCTDDRDRAGLIEIGSANFQGALILFTKCQPQNSFSSHSFQRTPIWIKVEGLPLLYNKLSVARRALEKLGTILYFDSNSLKEGFKDYLRAKVLIPINNPLVPGVYFNRQEGPRVWVDFRYEGVFTFCSKCGRIGHRRPRCRIPMAVAKNHFAMVLEDIGQGIFLPIVSPFITPLFTNKLIGLKRVERLRTTRINLVQHSEERDAEGDSLSEQTIDEDENNNNNNNDGSSSSDSSNNDDSPPQNNGNSEGQSRNKEGNHNVALDANRNDSHSAGTSKRKRDHSSGNQHSHKSKNQVPLMNQGVRKIPSASVSGSLKIINFHQCKPGRQKLQSTVEATTTVFKVQGNAKNSIPKEHSMLVNLHKRKGDPAGQKVKEISGNFKKRKKRSEELLDFNLPNYQKKEDPLLKPAPKKQSESSSK
ncbi:hypothetical protein BVRB_009020 [Beta vulgaris subsp. vulgaris]|uniref:Zinc knuckle CX2CX4HX4C domain-containing protein n=1 Tax=Beta vulgaris subsp. vulgaris TaxID=3555 RepID=A0A0J8DWW6_BETVV|nr:hypothetical protein BVRB_009020 [Beta vulgaris subsp. vulgaris]